KKPAPLQSFLLALTGLVVSGTVIAGILRGVGAVYPTSSAAPAYPTTRKDDGRDHRERHPGRTAASAGGHLGRPGGQFRAVLGQCYPGRTLPLRRQRRARDGAHRAS